MATQKLKYAGIGTSQTLNSRIEHLANLLRNLPETLPLNPDQSCYYFGADSHEVSTFILNPNAIDRVNHRGNEQNLQVVGEMENLWSYNDQDGCLWSEVLAEGGAEEMEDMYMSE